MLSSLWKLSQHSGLRFLVFCGPIWERLGIVDFPTLIEVKDLVVDKCQHLRSILIRGRPLQLPPRGLDPNLHLQAIPRTISRKIVRFKIFYESFSASRVVFITAERAQSSCAQVSFSCPGQETPPLSTQLAPNHLGSAQKILEFQHFSNYHLFIRFYRIIRASKSRPLTAIGHFVSI